MTIVFLSQIPFFEELYCEVLEMDSFGWEYDIFFILGAYGLLKCYHRKRLYSFMRKRCVWIKDKCVRIKDKYEASNRGQKIYYSCYLLMLISFVTMQVQPELAYGFLLFSIPTAICGMLQMGGEKSIQGVMNYIFLMLILNSFFLYFHLSFLVYMKRDCYPLLYLGMFMLQVFNMLGTIKYIESAFKDKNNVIVVFCGVMAGVGLMCLCNYLLIGTVKYILYTPKCILSHFDLHNIYVWLALLMYGIKESANLCITMNDDAKMWESLLAYILSCVNVGVVFVIILNTFSNSLGKNRYEK